VKIYHFYHIYADGKWLIPVLEHFRALRKSKLAKNLAQLSIGMAGSLANRQKLARFLKAYCWLFRLDYEIAAEDVEGWEQVTLEQLHEFSKTHDGYVFYAHTKGAANNIKPNPLWRRLMTRYNVQQWETAVQQLKHHKAVGCYWLLPEDLHVSGYYFGGNFWWAHLSLIRTLDKPSRETRHHAESWLGQNYETNPFPIYDLHPGFPHVIHNKRSLLRRLAGKIKRLKTGT